MPNWREREREREEGRAVREYTIMTIPPVNPAHVHGGQRRMGDGAADASCHRSLHVVRQVVLFVPIHLYKIKIIKRYIY
jgi:hypothetical protein